LKAHRYLLREGQLLLPEVINFGRKYTCWLEVNRELTLELSFEKVKKRVPRIFLSPAFLASFTFPFLLNIIFAQLSSIKYYSLLQRKISL
jgi:hypothetical protein